MPIDESLADIPEWRKPLREWWSRTGPTHLSPSTLGHNLSNGTPGWFFGCQKMPVGYVEGLWNRTNYRGESLMNKFWFYIFMVYKIFGDFLLKNSPAESLWVFLRCCLIRGMFASDALEDCQRKGSWKTLVRHLVHHFTQYVSRCIKMLQGGPVPTYSRSLRLSVWSLVKRQTHVNIWCHIMKTWSSSWGLGDFWIMPLYVIPSFQTCGSSRDDPDGSFRA